MSLLTIYVIQSAHTDIGYTHPQEQIARMYLEHYERVIDLCRQTADRTESERFKWVCETFWQVENFLNYRPERLEEFLYFVRNGQIEITASYLHFTDLIDADAYRHSIQLAVDFCKQYDLPLRTAMHCDINGWAWSVADILAENDIPYFCSQVHIDNATDPLGERGSVHYHWIVENPQIRSDAPIRVPQAFWWQGPQNGRVLHWLNEHYLLGNVLGVSSPKPFGADKTRYFYETDQLTSDDLYKIASRELARYVNRLREVGYARDTMLLSTGGYYVDNSRPDDRWLDVIAKWNAEHDEIKLRSATLSEWFDALTNQGTDSLPQYRVAWPDHWAHGLGSSTMRIAQARRSQRRRADVTALVKASKSKAASEFLDLALQQERLSLEHTFDAWSTAYRPEAPANHFQQIVKEMTFYRAELYLDEASGTALRALNDSNADKSELIVPSRDNAQHILHFDAGDQVIDPEQHALVDRNNQVYAIQFDNDRLRQFVAVVPTQETAYNAFSLSAYAEHSSNSGDDEARRELSNDFWRLQLDANTGGLLHLQEAGNQHEWVAPNNAYSFGQLIHEKVVHPLKYDGAGNLARIIALDVATEEARQNFANVPVFERSQTIATQSIRRNQGRVFDALIWQGEVEDIGQLVMTWRLYHQVPIVELVIDWNKQWNELPEASYIAFPFNTADATLELETSGGFFQPGSHGENGQLPGTCSSYYTVQRGARITDGDNKLLWLPLDAPLVMPNEINYSRWETDPWKWNGLLASMPVNHYWHTNFPTSQRGYIRLRYRFVNPALFASDEAAIQGALPVDAFGWR